MSEEEKRKRAWSLGPKKKKKKGSRLSFGAEIGKREKK